MEGILIFNGLSERPFIKACMNYGERETYVDEFRINYAEDEVPTEFFIVGAPKLLIQW